MPEITFHHPIVSNKLEKGDLVISTGADQISWGYNLNTQTFPTYGGEVVQILSAYTDDITVTGTIRSYRKMEEIYDWFLTYMQIASQGYDTTPGREGDKTAYNQQPIVMEYPIRGWKFKIQVTSLPGFKYGLEVVAPTWQIVAHVVDDDPEVSSINEAAAVSGLQSLHAGIGYNPDDPFSDPFATNATDGVSKIDSDRKSGQSLRELYDNAADYFSGLIPKYLDGDYTTLTGGIGSKPALLKQGLPDSALNQIKPSPPKPKAK